MGVEKRCVARGGNNIIFRRGGGGINIVFGPKYRPLAVFPSSSRILLLSMESGTSGRQGSTGVSTEKAMGVVSGLKGVTYQVSCMELKR